MNLPSDIVQHVLAALRNGRVVMHPTDTIPGLTFDPTNPLAWETLCRIKGRESTKQVLCLVDSVSTAQKLWRPLPAGWDEKLVQLWPGPVSVIWKAASSMPAAICAADGTIGLRFPKWDDDHAWYQEVLTGMGGYLPTTSMNFSGEPPARTAEACDAFFAKQPDVLPITVRYFADRQPSTLIKIDRDGGWHLLRAGQDVERVREICGAETECS